MVNSAAFAVDFLEVYQIALLRCRSRPKGADCEAIGPSFCSQGGQIAKVGCTGLVLSVVRPRGSRMLRGVRASLHVQIGPSSILSSRGAADSLAFLCHTMHYLRRLKQYKAGAL